MMRAENSQVADSINYKKKYQALKKKLRLLVYEQECFVDELKKSQRKLLKVSRDKSFLLDRLLQYEHPDETSSDSESTASSDSGNEVLKDSGRKKRPTAGHISSSAASLAPSGGLASAHVTALNVSGDSSSGLIGRISKEPPKKKKVPTVRKVPPKIGQPRAPSLSKGQTVSGNTATAGLFNQPSGLARMTPTVPLRNVMSREEIERHLDLKHSTKPKFLSLDATPHSLPDDIFSHDSSNQDCPELSTDTVKVEMDDSDLVIDMA